jgi:hypothetical protein
MNLWSLPEILALLQGPAQPSQLIAPSWPLQRWGIDIMGNLTPAQGNYTFTIVAVEYYTKWVEAKPMTNITSTTIQKIFWQDIICCYGVPQQTTIDNAKYFESAMFKFFCHQVGTNVFVASLYHPQSNGAVEWANALIFEAIKKILKGKRKGSMEPQHHDLKSHQFHPVLVVVRSWNSTTRGN